MEEEEAKGDSGEEECPKDNDPRSTHDACLEWNAAETFYSSPSCDMSEVRVM